MRVNTKLLKEKISEANLTQEKTATMIGIDNSTFIRKMKSDGLSFTIKQMYQLCTVLSLSNEEARNIFFS